MSKSYLWFIALLAGFFCFNTSIYAQQKFVANLAGLQQVPANLSVGKGLCKLTLAQNETQVEVICNYSNLSSSVTAVHLHSGAAVGATAPVLIPFPTGAGSTSGAFGAAFNFSSPQFITNLRANRLYVDVHTINFPKGELRGQIKLANGTYNDFDADGRTDLTVYRNSNNTFYARSSVSGNLISQMLGQTGDSVSLTVDFDGDGKSDFSTARYNAQVIWRIFKSTTGAVQETQWGSSTLGDFFAAADYDGDGTFDIAVFRAGVWHIIKSSTGNYRYERFGQSGDIPAPNDFDRDGKADLAVARSENGQRAWYIRRGADNQFYRVGWGLSSDAFFTGRADWDGDGAADISVIRTENGQRIFYIRRSSDEQLQIIRWGAPSDLVKLGDYDGDGKTDAAVTRTINNQKVFLILQSSTGEPRYEYFGLPGDF